MSDIVFIINDFLLGLELISAIDLRKAGESGSYRETILEFGDVFVKFLIEAFSFGTRTDKAHIADEDIKKLGKLVQPAPAKSTPELSAAHILRVGPFRTILLGVDMHSAEFEHCEGLAAPAEPLLTEQGGAF